MLVSGRKGRLGYMMKTPHQSHSQNFCGDPRGVAGGDGKIGSLSGKCVLLLLTLGAHARGLL